MRYADYAVFKTPANSQGGVIIFIRWQLHPRISNIYDNHTLSVQISDAKHRLYVIGAYIHQASQVVASSVLEEMKQIQKNFLEAKIILAGDLNDSFDYIERKLEK